MLLICLKVEKRFNAQNSRKFKNCRHLWLVVAVATGQLVVIVAILAAASRHTWLMGPILLDLNKPLVTL